ncbi:C-GCAxxG-C-C family protein [Clostridium magnum]|uniref:Putative redox-active protein n=1 Tax=Clostridium magnum DSM 2767 TaxID=1121326 RepID=A0A162SVT6_9CLOT|nr:C-GCAxxG-C-C family protein [Clostridium magnum]KZL91927.1 putative redox-active protein [Clostridium magnum DSM 2767]SHH29544.1 C_GCAxxG_C_C family probable redox protein [Clostridium magnum DSM 2767]
MGKSEEAIVNFEKGLNCSQCVLLAFSEELRVEKDLALKISYGFGGGMCQGEVCGAVTGAIIVINLRYGQNTIDDKESKEEIYKKIREFSEKFRNINGSIICRDLLGYDLKEEGERNRARENGVFTVVCPKAVKDAIEILENIL